MTAQRCRRDVPQLFNMYALPWECLDVPGLSSRLNARVLSRDDATDAMTLLVQLPAGWSAPRAEPAPATVELFVIHGELTVDEERIGPGGFLALPPGPAGERLASPSGGMALLFWDPTLDADFYYGSQRYLSHSWEQPWNLAARPGDVPILAGSTNASLYKSLRPVDPNDEALRGGANGFLRLFFFLPGFGFPRHDVHRQSWEEVIFLLGDCFMADRGLLGPGSYVGNPPTMLHGPMMSQRGSLMVIHNTAAQGFETYDTFPHGEDLTRWYLEHASLYDEPLTVPWAETEGHAVWSELVRGLKVPAFPRYLDDGAQGGLTRSSSA